MTNKIMEEERFSPIRAEEVMEKFGVSEKAALALLIISNDAELSEEQRWKYMKEILEDRGESGLENQSFPIWM